MFLRGKTTEGAWPAAALPRIMRAPRALLRNIVIGACGWFPSVDVFSFEVIGP
jgi:hypothetical protein